MKKGMKDDGLIGSHHLLNGLEFEQTLGGKSEGQGSLVYCSSGVERVGCDLMTEQQQRLV